MQGKGMISSSTFRRSAVALASVKRMSVSRRCRLGAAPVTVLWPSRLAFEKKLWRACNVCLTPTSISNGPPEGSEGLPQLQCLR